MIRAENKKSIFSWLFSLLLHIGLLSVLLYAPHNIKQTKNETVLNIDILSTASTPKQKIHKRKSVRRKTIKIKHHIIQQKKKPVQKQKKRKIATKKYKKRTKTVSKRLKPKTNNNNLHRIRERIRKERMANKAVEKQISNIFQKINTKIRQTSSQKASYQKLIKLLIKNQWKINKYMLKKANYTAIVKVVIAKSGRLILTKFKQRSGNRYYDKTCIDAVRAAAPFPPYKASNDRIVEIILTCHVPQDKFD